METFIYWTNLPTKLQMKVLKRTNIVDLIRCRWTCKSMELIVFNKEFQLKYSKRHGPAPSEFVFNVYLLGKSDLAINIHNRPMSAKCTLLATNGNCTSLEPVDKSASSTILNPNTIGYRSLSLPSIAPTLENGCLEPQVMALPKFGEAALARLAPTAAEWPSTSSAHPSRHKRKYHNVLEDGNPNHLMQFWKPPNYYTNPDMYNSFYQSIFRSKDPIEVINLSDSDGE